MTRPRCPVSIFAILFLYSTTLCAQESRGSITGQVTDASGAVVPHVKVSATNTATNVSTAATTNVTGNYSIFYLIPGVYDLSAEAAGFATIGRRGNERHIGDKLCKAIQFTDRDMATS